MPENKEFMQLLDRMRETHKKKNDDYSSSGPDENFERMATISNWFKYPLDKVFATMVAVKLARLGVLLSSQNPPNNESVDDSFLDLTVYCGLWAANYKRRPSGGNIMEYTDGVNHPNNSPSEMTCDQCGKKFIGPPSILYLKVKGGDIMPATKLFCNVWHKEDYITRFIKVNDEYTYSINLNLIS